MDKSSHFHKCMPRRFLLLYFYLYWCVLIVLTNVVHCDISTSGYTHVVHTYQGANLASVYFSASMVHHFPPPPTMTFTHKGKVQCLSLSLAYFPLCDFLQFCVFCYGWQSSTLPYGWVMSHCLYVLRACWWAPKVVAALALMNGFTEHMAGKHVCGFTVCLWHTGMAGPHDGTLFTS